MVHNRFYIFLFVASFFGGSGTYWATRRSWSSGYASVSSSTEDHANETTASAYNQTATEKNQTKEVWREVGPGVITTVDANWNRSSPAMVTKTTGIDQLAQEGSGEEATEPKADNRHLNEEVTRDPNPRHWNHAPRSTLTGIYTRPSSFASFLSIDEAIRNYAEALEEIPQSIIDNSGFTNRELTNDLVLAIWVYHFDHFCYQEGSIMCKRWLKKDRAEMASSAVETAMSNVKWSAAIYNSIGHNVKSLNELYRRIHAVYCSHGSECNFDFWVGLRVARFCLSNRHNNQTYRKFCRAHRQYYMNTLRQARDLGLHHSHWSFA